jgi:hypothetical protein
MVSLGANYFSIEDDELMDEAPTNLQELSWRGDPSTNWSDWTVIIHNTGDDSTKSYHVHRNILAAGSRRCEYFSTLFNTRAAIAEQQDCTSRISLDAPEASAFEIMLNFCYNEGKLNACVDNVVALRNLARYFQCRELLRFVNEFIQGDLSIDNAVLYLRGAFQRDEKLETAARKLTCEQIHSIAIHSMDTLSTDIFRSIICCETIKEEHHKYVSVHIKSFFDVNPEKVSAKLLNDFTFHLTEIDASVAHGFLELISRLDPNDQDKDSWLALDRLSQACAAALAPKWASLDTNNNGMNKFINPSSEGDYRGAGRCVVPLLEASLKRAQQDYNLAKAQCAALEQQNQVLQQKVNSMMGRMSTIETLGDRLRAIRRLDFAVDSDSVSTASSVASSLSSSSSSSAEELEVYTSGSDTSGSMDEW